DAGRRVRRSCIAAFRGWPGALGGRGLTPLPLERREAHAQRRGALLRSSVLRRDRHRAAVRAAGAAANGRRPPGRLTSLRYRFSCAGSPAGAGIAWGGALLRSDGRFGCRRRLRVEPFGRFGLLPRELAARAREERVGVVL